jgi:dihydroxyacetone kinase
MTSLAANPTSYQSRNYTGDVLNFGLAKERYVAEHPSSSNLRMVVVGDDVSVGKTQSAIVGRRFVFFNFPPIISGAIPK